MSRVQNTGNPQPIPPNGGGNSYLDWSVHIKVKKHEFGGTFSVFIFLGEVPENPGDWYSSPSFVGENTVMVGGYGGPRGGDVYAEGVVHLNRVIAARSGLSSFEEDVVLPYLKDKLAWRVRTVCPSLFQPQIRRHPDDL